MSVIYTADESAAANRLCDEAWRSLAADVPQEQPARFFDLRWAGHGVRPWSQDWLVDAVEEVLAGADPQAFVNTVRLWQILDPEPWADRTLRLEDEFRLSIQAASCDAPEEEIANAVDLWGFTRRTAYFVADFLDRHTRVVPWRRRRTIRAAVRALLEPPRTSAIAAAAAGASEMHRVVLVCSRVGAAVGLSEHSGLAAGPNGVFRIPAVRRLTAERWCDVEANDPVLEDGDVLAGYPDFWLDEVEHRVFTDREAIRTGATDRPKRIAWPLPLMAKGEDLCREAWQAFAKTDGVPSWQWAMAQAQRIRRVRTPESVLRSADPLRTWFSGFTRGTRQYDQADSWGRVVVAFLVSAANPEASEWLDRLITSGWFSPAEHDRVIQLLDTFTLLNPAANDSTFPPSVTIRRRPPWSGMFAGPEDLRASVFLAIREIISAGGGVGDCSRAQVADWLSQRVPKLAGLNNDTLKYYIRERMNLTWSELRREALDRLTNG